MRCSMSSLIAFRSATDAPGLYLRKVASVTPFIVAPPGSWGWLANPPSCLRTSGITVPKFRSMTNTSIDRNRNAKANDRNAPTDRDIWSSFGCWGLGGLCGYVFAFVPALTPEGRKPGEIGFVLLGHDRH